MSTTLKSKLDKIPDKRRKKIQSRAAELIEEEMSLVKLRHALKLTQERVAENLSMRQEGVSRLEKRSDLLLSTLRNYINAMGGDLNLIVEFPDRKPIKLHGIGEIDSQVATSKVDATKEHYRRNSS